VNHHPVIAVLDDEPQLRKALERLLTAHGFTVTTYGQGADAFAALSAQPADCLLLDLHMPGLNGFDILQGFAARGITMPVVVLTGHGAPDTAGRVRELGAVAYLTKPVDESALIDAIHAAIGTPQQERPA
jgi:FixJ family two-component response regulator